MNITQRIVTLEPNEQILQRRMEAFNRRAGARVGDFLRLPQPDPRCPEFTRFTHDWGDSIQTGGMDGSFYLGHGFLSYSGGLDPGIAHTDLLPTTETKPGHVWFFDGDISGAGRGVSFSVLLRVFVTRPGADLTGVWEMHCPYNLTVWETEEAEKRGHRYRFTVSHHSTAHNAFNTEQELRAWLTKMQLALVRDITTPGYQQLAYSSVPSCYEKQTSPV
jgi:hypothetical protein